MSTVNFDKMGLYSLHDKFFNIKIYGVSDQRRFEQVPDSLVSMSPNHDGS